MNSLVKQLATKSDVLLENFKPGSEYRLAIRELYRLILDLQRWKNGIWAPQIFVH